MKESKWFKQQQQLLLIIANTDAGRDLLCIDKTFPRIEQIGVNYIIGTNYTGEKIAEFRIGAKYANLIRHRWTEFQLMVQWFSEFHSMFPVTAIAGRRFLTSTTYPDPDPETTTVDGIVYRNGDTADWSVIRGNTIGTAAVDTTATDAFYQVEATATTNKWNNITRSFFLFDTSALTASATISAATLSLIGSSSSNSLSATAAQTAIHIVASTPASNTALVTEDYDQTGATSFGSFAFADFSTSAYNDITLDANGIANISKTAVSKFGAKAGADVNNSEPTWGSTQDIRISGKFADTAVTTSEPKLTVTYTLPATGGVGPSGGVWNSSSFIII